MAVPHVKAMFLNLLSRHVTSSMGAALVLTMLQDGLPLRLLSIWLPLRFLNRKIFGSTPARVQFGSTAAEGLR